MANLLINNALANTKSDINVSRALREEIKNDIKALKNQTKGFSEKIEAMQKKEKKINSSINEARRDLEELQVLIQDDYSEFSHSQIEYGKLEVKVHGLWKTLSEGEKIQNEANEKLAQDFERNSKIKIALIYSSGQFEAAKSTRRKLLNLGYKASMILSSLKEVGSRLEKGEVNVIYKEGYRGEANYIKRFIDSVAEGKVDVAVEATEFRRGHIQLLFY